MTISRDWYTSAMRLRNTLIIDALAIVGVIAMWYVITLDRARSDDDQISAPVIAVADLPIDQITEITLTRDDGIAMTFERSGLEWRQTAPFDHPMDAYSVRQLCVAAADLTISDTVEADDDAIASLGLAPPRATIRYTWPDGSTTIRLGRSAMAGQAYLQVGDGGIVITQKTLHDRGLTMDPREWRDRQLFRYAGIESDRIGWSSGGQTLELVRDRRTWSMTAPVTTRLDTLARDEYVQTLGRVRHNGFILDHPEDLAMFGLDQPVGTLEITSTRHAGDTQGTEAVTERLLIGARISASSQDRYAMVEGRPVVVHLNETAIAALFRRAVDLVDPTAAGTNPADVKSLRIVSGGHDFELARDLDRWIAPEHDGLIVDAHVVNTLLEHLTTLRASKVAIGEYPIDLEVGTVTFFGHGGQPLDTVRITRDPQTQNWALENGDLVLRLQPASVEFPLTPAAFGITAP